LNQQITEEHRQHARLHQLMQQAEKRVHATLAQVNDLVAREQQMMTEKKELRKRCFYQI
jgi:hypothetical protein